MFLEVVFPIKKWTESLKFIFVNVICSDSSNIYTSSVHIICKGRQT